MEKKDRAQWQLNQWAEAMRWYLNWLRFCQDNGKNGLSMQERVARAVHLAGARRGLARRTRDTYARCAGRFAKWVGEDAREVMNPTRASEWLGLQVTERQVSFSTQKQALNALVFFFKDVCGMAEVELNVRMRKTPKRIPVVLKRLLKNSETKNLFVLGHKNCGFAETGFKTTRWAAALFPPDFVATRSGSGLPFLVAPGQTKK